MSGSLGADSDFNGTPAIGNGQIFIRSKQAVYCIAGVVEFAKIPRAWGILANSTTV